jgi:hypothetical protein
VVWVSCYALRHKQIYQPQIYINLQTLILYSRGRGLLYASYRHFGARTLLPFSGFFWDTH